MWEEGSNKANVHNAKMWAHPLPNAFFPLPSLSLSNNETFNAQRDIKESTLY